METKNVGLIISLMGGIGTLASVAVLFLLRSSCTLVIEFYNQALIVLMPVFLALLVMGLYLFFKPEQVRIKTVIKTTKIERILTPEERRLLEFLKGKKEVTQADIRRELNIPKATLAVLLQRMEKRKLIRKEKIGKTNYVIPMKGF